MISLMTTFPAAEALVPPKTTLTLLLAPVMGRPVSPTPVIFNIFVPVTNGTVTVQPVSDVHVSG